MMKFGTGLLLAAAIGTASAATPCEQLAALKFKDAVVTGASLAPEGKAPPVPYPGAPPPAVIPAHCRVQLDLKPSPDSLIRMEMWLPSAETWNGKFMGAGNGGSAGSIQGLHTGMPEALLRGYATAGTDTGHQGDGMSFGIGHPEKMVDFAYRSTHEMTLKARQVIKAYYGSAAKKSYFSSCSTGGRMGLMEAQRYPEDYDGIVAGAPANRHLHMWLAGAASTLDPLQRPERSLSAAQATLVNNLVTSKCDTLKEGFLNNPRQCQVDFAVLRCGAGQSGDACLTDAQLMTVRATFAGTRNAKGELVYSGRQMGFPLAGRPDEQGLAAAGRGMSGLYDLVRIARNDPGLDWKTLDLERDLPVVDREIGYVDAVNPDLQKFKARGGKLLMYHGWADFGITPENSIHYYETVLDRMGPGQDDWLRLFMLPGMGHCRGGPGVQGFDSTTALEQWVEKGFAPKELLGTSSTSLTRPLCPFPKYAEYSGTGEVKDAKNWSCKIAPM